MPYPLSKPSAYIPCGFFFFKGYVIATYQQTPDLKLLSGTDYHTCKSSADKSLDTFIL